MNLMQALITALINGSSGTGGAYDALESRVAALEAVAPIIPVSSKSEMIDHDAAYLYNGTIWRWGTKSVETTTVVPAKACILKGKRFSHSSQDWVSGGTALAALIVPVISSGTPQTFQLRDTAGIITISNSYTACYYGSANNAFPDTASLVKTTPIADISNVASGEKFLVMCINMNGADDDFSGSTLTVDGTEMPYDVVTESPTARQASTTTTSETVSDFFDTGVAYGNGQNVVQDTGSSTSDVMSQKAVTAALAKISKRNMEQYIGTVRAPRPQLPADDSASADIDLEIATAADLYALIDTSANRYPEYAYKQIPGKDASGVLDVARYTLGKRYWSAWVKQGYGHMYAWKNGSTVIYSATVSPRVGDTMYSTGYVGTSAGTVSAVSGENQSRTVSSVEYVRSPEDDVAATILYRPIYEASNGKFYRKDGNDMIYVVSKATLTRTQATMTNGDVYLRYPVADLSRDFERKVQITVIANEHGGYEQKDPALVTARLIRDLCEGTDNPVLNYIREHAILTVIPIVNPWGFNKFPETNGYRNYNAVNINRNYDTPGWEVFHAANSGAADGAYPGSENETQYVMDALSESHADVAISVHGLLLSASQNRINYQGQNPDGLYSEAKLQALREDYFAAYEIPLIPYNPLECPPDETAKSPSYFTHVGAYGGIIELYSSDAQIADGESGRHYTAWVMEQEYTYLLKALAMFISDWQDSLR